MTATLDDLKRRARGILALFQLENPDAAARGELEDVERVVEAVEALPDRKLFDRLAPEMRAPFEPTLHELGIRHAGPAKPAVHRRRMRSM